jgi:hypothetical protein
MTLTLSPASGNVEHSRFLPFSPSDVKYKKGAQRGLFELNGGELRMAKKRKVKMKLQPGSKSIGNPEQEMVA